MLNINNKLLYLVKIELFNKIVGYITWKIWQQRVFAIILRSPSDADVGKRAYKMLGNRCLRQLVV